MKAPVLDTIREWLRSQQVSFRELHHQPTRTSAEAAAVRGEPLEFGGKSLLLKVGEQFRLFVLPADRQLNSRAIRDHLGARKLRFASAEELRQMTGLVPGSVPPFGRPILDFDLYVDIGIDEHPRIAFNAGSLVDSIIMPVADYLRVANPQGRFDFSTRSE